MNNTDGNTFLKAKPIWLQSKELEKNITMGLRTAFVKKDENSCILRIAGSSLYRFFINGKFVGHGPATGPHNYYRVDEWDLSEHTVQGKNILAIEVVGYNVNSFYLLDQPSFVQAEVEFNQRIIASTNERDTNFETTILEERVQKVQRYSYQRPFSEYYRLKQGVHKWRSNPHYPVKQVDCSVVENKNIIPRGVSYPTFEKQSPLTILSEGKVKFNSSKEIKKQRSLTAIGPQLKGFKENDLEVLPLKELGKLENASQVEKLQSYEKDRIVLKQNEFAIVDFGINYSGFIGATIHCEVNTRLFFTFDEVLRDGDIELTRMNVTNIVGYECEPGEYSIQSIEPYTFKYLKIIVLDGECCVEDLYIQEYTSPDADKAEFECDDNRLNRVFEAGRETFKQNSVDNFYDCPSRERAGWLCDSFFTSRVALDLSGNTVVERNFLENFLLPDHFPHLPEGMLPMCYPSDHNKGTFIPNWALWFVVQLEEYLERSADRKMVDALKPRVLDLFKYFEKFENEDGLLESLDGWVFVEWSMANKLVQDVNYPSNMLFAGALSAIGRLYDMPHLEEKGENIRQNIREQSFNGKFFVDNAVRVDGELQVTNESTEACQYYAFFFNIATKNTHQQLWNVLTQKFGPNRKINNEYPDVHMANAFIGNYLRLELLSKYGYTTQIVDELADYFMYMAEKTGTLWEHDGDRASCNHGFASHVTHILYRDILGLYQVDAKKKRIELHFSELPLNKCRGKIPVEDGVIELSWKKDEQNLYYQLIAPDGYVVNVVNNQKLQLQVDK